MYMHGLIQPNFSQNAANFSNSMDPGPIPKKGCESPEPETENIMT